MRTVDLFAGSGGLSKGFEEAGYEIVAAFENWEPAIKTYRQNFSHPVFALDLSDVDGASSLLIDEFKPEVIIGGPPCQDFSSAGKRTEAARADLTVAFAEIVARVRPRFFVMENVDRARLSDAFGIARDIFTSAGYGLMEFTLDASRYGVPQKRKRFFCIGGQGLPDNFVERSVEELAAEKPMTMREYFGELDFDHYYRHPRNYSRRAVFSVDEPAPTMRGVNRPVPGGYLGHALDSAPVRPGIRPLTTDERAAIQTFPSDFTWVGSRTQVEQLIGNAVPVALGKFVADYLSLAIDRDPHAYDEKQFENWLGNTGKYTSSRSIADVVSRLRRANRLVEIPRSSDEQYLLRLEAHEGFKGLPTTVRSQIRHAVRAYFDYLESELVAVP